MASRLVILHKLHVNKYLSLQQSEPSKSYLTITMTWMRPQSSSDSPPRTFSSPLSYISIPPRYSLSVRKLISCIGYSPISSYHTVDPSEAVDGSRSTLLFDEEDPAICTSPTGHTHYATAHGAVTMYAVNADDVRSTVSSPACDSPAQTKLVPNRRNDEVSVEIFTSLEIGRAHV